MVAKIATSLVLMQPYLRVVAKFAICRQTYDLSPNLRRAQNRVAKVVLLFSFEVVIEEAPFRKEKQIVSNNFTCNATTILLATTFLLDTTILLDTYHNFA